MNQQMQKYILLLILLFPVASHLNGQILNSKSFFSISGGKLIFGGPDELFFPKGMDNSGLSFRADYLRNIFPWMKIGAESSLVLPGLPNQSKSDYAQITNKNEKIITIGVNATFFLPFRDTGWRNRLRFQFGVAPVVVAHTGSRTLTIDNIITTIGDYQSEIPVLFMKGPATGFGLSLTPSIEYYISQRVGLRISCNSLLTSMKSDLTTENVVINSLNFGLCFALSRNKQINY